MLDRNFISVANKDNYLYWVTERKGIFMRLDLSNLEVTYLCPKCDDIELYGCGVLGVDEDTLYVSACGGEYLVKYDLTQNICKYFWINLGKLSLHDFSSAIITDKEIVVMAYSFSQIIRINKNDGNVNYEEIRELHNGIREYYWPAQVLAYNSNIWCMRGQDCLKYCGPNSDGHIAYKIKGIENDPIAIHDTGECIYILDNAGGVYEWCIGDIEASLLYRISEVSGKYAFWGICCVNEKIWIMPCYEDKILYIDKNIGVCTQFTDYPTEFTYFDIPNMGKYGTCLKVGNAYYFSMHTGSHIFRINSDGSGEFLDVKWPEEVDEIKYLLARDGSIDETNTLSIEEFLEFI